LLLHVAFAFVRAAHIWDANDLIHSGFSRHSTLRRRFRFGLDCTSNQRLALIPVHWTTAPFVTDSTLFAAMFDACTGHLLP
jgi:hypothetical protein